MPIKPIPLFSQNLIRNLYEQVNYVINKVLNVLLQNWLGLNFN